MINRICQKCQGSLATVRAVDDNNEEHFFCFICAKRVVVDGQTPDTDVIFEKSF